MITTKDSVKSLEHRHGGNGYAVIQWLPNQYCRVVFWSNVQGKAEIGDRAFLAWTKLLEVEKALDPETGDRQEVLIPPNVLELLSAKQRALESGAETIVNQRFVAVK